MYKIYFKERFFCLSSQPDRLQNYCLFHKFHDQNDLNNKISEFLDDNSKSCINIYSYKVNYLWKSFKMFFRFIEAAGGLVINENGQMLFIKRDNRWDLPKGHFEKGETAEQCAIREVTEETGIKPLKISKPLKPTYHIYTLAEGYILKKTHWFGMLFSGDIQTRPQTDEGISDAVWFDPQMVSEVKANTWRSVTDVINEIIPDIIEQ